MSQSAIYVERYLRRREMGAVKEILTPEGVPLRFTVATLPGRVGAFVIDLCIMLLAILVLSLPGLALLPVGPGFALAWVLLAMFFVTNFYFIFFEIRRQGTTPGKRANGLKVIDRHGGVLQAEAVFARNLMRQVEFFIPLQIVLSIGAMSFDTSGLVALISIGWLLILALLPAFNRDRLRAGDLVAGTIVVLAPREMLHGDLIAEVSPRDGRLEFTAEQLDVYGVYELQVLEDLLRQDGVADAQALETVCMKIRRKIGWDLTSWVDPREFLNAFYAAQRGRLERGMMLGKRREKKE